MSSTVALKDNNKEELQADDIPHHHPTISLRIPELMAAKGIRHVSTLHRLLISKKIKISHSQLLRIVDNRFDHINKEYLEAFLDIFQCSIADLFKVE